MEAGVRSVFLLGTVAMLISFLLVLTIPEVSMDAIVEEKKVATSRSRE
jgi:competence protein ComGC